MTEQAFSKYREFVKNGDEVSLLVLKGHLAVEELLTAIVKTILGSNEEINDARLSFHQKRLLAKAGAGRNSQDTVWKILEAINSLRNDIGHNLEPTKSTILINKIESQLKNRDPEGYALIPDLDNKADILSHAVSFCIGYLEAYLREKNA